MCVHVQVSLPPQGLGGKAVAFFVLNRLLVPVFSFLTLF